MKAPNRDAWRKLLTMERGVLDEINSPTKPAPATRGKLRSREQARSDAWDGGDGSPLGTVPYTREPATPDDILRDVRRFYRNRRREALTDGEHAIAYTALLDAEGMAQAVREGNAGDAAMLAFHAGLVLGEFYLLQHARPAGSGVRQSVNAEKQRRKRTKLPAGAECVKWLTKFHKDHARYSYSHACDEFAKQHEATMNAVKKAVAKARKSTSRMW